MTAPSLPPPVHMASPAVREWSVWTTQARVVVTDPAALDAAADVVRVRTERVDRAASRFRPDSEVSRIAASGRTRHVVSGLLAGLLDQALQIAATTGGAVDPTMGNDLVRLGYPGGHDAGVTVSRSTTWQNVQLRDRELRLPAGTLLDLGATAKAATADWCAGTIADRLGVGVLVGLGGDLAVAGDPVPLGGWTVDVCDGADQPRSVITLTTARGLATSSTLHRTWTQRARRMHHVLDPLTRQPAPPAWRTVSVAAGTCLLANAYATEALVRGWQAPARLRATGLAARLVGQDGSVVRLNGWPA